MSLVPTISRPTHNQPAPCFILQCQSNPSALQSKTPWYAPGAHSTRPGHAHTLDAWASREQHERPAAQTCHQSTEKGAALSTAPTRWRCRAACRRCFCLREVGTRACQAPTRRGASSVVLQSQSPWPPAAPPAQPQTDEPWPRQYAVSFPRPGRTAWPAWPALPQEGQRRRYQSPAAYAEPPSPLR